MIEYVNLKPNERATHIRIDMYYRKDSTPRAPRGYYLSVFPVTRETRHGVTLESMECFSGSVRLLMEVSRKSAKAEKEAQERADLIRDIMVARMCSQHGLEVEE